ALSMVGALGVYFWARTFLSQTAAAWAGIFYALAPYHVNQLYQATLFAEYAAAAVLPFAFAFVDRVCIHGRRRDIAGLAFVYAILLFTHLPLAIIGSLALLVYSAVYLAKSRKLITIAKLSLAVALGLCASAVYWVTMIAEMSWIAVNRVHPDASVDYRANFVLQTISSDNLNVWWMNILSLMTLLLFAPLVVFLRRSAAAQSKTLKCLLPVIVMTLCACFMALPLSRPLWDVWPQLQQVQFPWRWLAMVSMGGSLIAGAAVSTWKADPRALPRQWRTLVLGAMIISIAFTLSHVVREAQYLSPAKFEETLSEIRGSASVNYWFPIWANSNAPQMHHQIEVDSRQLSIYSWQAEHRQFAVAAGPATEARVRTFYYPHWSATTNGISLPTRPAADGALLISLPTEAVRVSLDFREPARNRFSAAASLTGLCLIAALAFPLRKQRI
ncbi:MAG TPA: 6-pyruvoyl-tetrahydropterin synthase-related protein, partial [Pyrinomonadaceae bacterium]|nr:6-pyruvoyl-tetrahydropterin synthase-related protein [Pyrinomonadaceae bacterium]